MATHIPIDPVPEGDDIDMLSTWSHGPFIRDAACHHDRVMALYDKGLIRQVVRNGEQNNALLMELTDEGRRILIEHGIELSRED
jgi:hypothetical protein